MDIAVVDDEKAIREHICALIEEQKPGCSIGAYAAGEELLTSGKRFDIVLLELSLGAGRIRRTSSLRGMPGMSFRFWHPHVSALETVQPRRRTDFSSTRLSGCSKHLVAVKKGKFARLYFEFLEMQDGGNAV